MKAQHKEFLGKTLRQWLIGLVSCLGVFLKGEAEAQSPSILYLTWTHDPTTTMTVQWHSNQKETSSVVLYQKDGDGVWLRQGGIYGQLEDSSLLVHTVELDGLEPDTLYRFQISGKGEAVYSFRTLPSDLSRPLKFVVGGDAYNHASKFRKMNHQIALQDPDFVVVGGDIAYTNNSRAVFKGRGWELNRWRRFLREWKSQMVTSDGRLIPLVPVLGNHDIKQTMLEVQPQYFLFYELFALAEKGMSYRELDIGDYLSLLLLDTGHSYHIEGQQTQWLAEQLSEREKRPYKMAIYHFGAYPSVYPFGGNGPKKIRAYWSPIFERYSVQVAFEHHNHAYKRTYPLKKGEIDPAGVVYVGDGSWGVSPRKPKAHWYLEKSAQVNAVNVVTLSSEKGIVEVIDLEGKLVDQFEIQPVVPAVAWNEATLLRYD